MPEHPDFLFWWGIGFAILISIGTIGTTIYTVLESRQKENRFRPTHRRTYPKC
ncbi:hypothetical protein LCGC14_2070570 [marine sediment metagenome]|uniref:Uncharacterized protein n=1 Tax=marine sediment metagenome TaxID=412755 RepID=A0A0F9GWY4_9ZZZZ